MNSDMLTDDIDKFDVNRVLIIATNVDEQATTSDGLTLKV